MIGWNDNAESPVAMVIAGWAASPPHRAILSDASFGRIGCADLADGTTHWFACVLAAGPLPAPATVVAPVVTALPDTAMADRPLVVLSRPRFVVL